MLEIRGLVELPERSLPLEGVPGGGILGLLGVWSNTTNPVGSDEGELGVVLSKGTNPVEPEADGLMGGVAWSVVKFARVVVAHPLTSGSGC